MGSPPGWCNLPWELWIKDRDFLRCVKELEQYWQQHQLLESVLDMTQAIKQPAESPAYPLPAAQE
jgi:hypothetical protein